MCRIAGIVSLKQVPDRQQRLDDMVNALVHGGPDDGGTFYDDIVALGHRRLSIIDLSSAGHQPMHMEDELVISFNGEIYNFLLLKKELNELGRVFQTNCDTEVILHAYAQWGTLAFDKFEGIFAFALYDRKKKKLLLVRDHVGVKPLYYYLDGDHLVFSSEVRAFKKFNPQWQENPDWRIFFLAFGSIPFPYTTLLGVQQLKPGSFLEVDLTDFSQRMVSYESKDIQPIISDAKETLDLIRGTVKAVLKKNLFSDAPLGVFLSGGIDSSLLVLLSEEFNDSVKTLSINFDESTYDESPFQRKVLETSRNVDHTAYRISERMFWDSLPDVWSAMDQPTIDGVNSYFVSRCAHRNGLKAVLSGLGADEIFGGYASFKRIKMLKRLRKYLPMKQTLAKILGYRKHAYRRLMYLNLPGPVGDYLFLRGIHTPDVIGQLLGIPENKVWELLAKVSVDIPDDISDIAYVSVLESKIYLSNQLLKDTDFMSMWHGVEVRVPYLDIELLRAVRSIIPANRYKDHSHKYLLTSSFHGVLPYEVEHREKKGFTFPIQLWISKHPERLAALIDRGKGTDQIMKNFRKGHDHWSKCWSLAVLKQFGAWK